MRKQLKVSGLKIKAFDVAIEKVINPNNNVEIEVVKLAVETDEGEWEYHLQEDENVKARSTIRDLLANALTQAQIDFSKVEISEYKERRYLTVKVKDHLDQQFTGEKIK